MGYNAGKDQEQYLRGANDYSHARLAKQMIGEKRAAKAGAPSGATTVDPLAEAAASETQRPGDVPESGPEVPTEGAEPLGEPGAEGKIAVEVTPDELAMLEQLRASKGAAGDAPPGDMPMPSRGAKIPRM